MYCRGMCGFSEEEEIALSSRVAGDDTASSTPPFHAHSLCRCQAQDVRPGLVRHSEIETSDGMGVESTKELDIRVCVPDPLC